MNNIVRFFNFNEWSIRRKLLLIVGLAPLIPLLLTFIVLDAGANERDLRSTELYVEEVGQQRRERLNEAVIDASQTLRNLVDNLRYRRDLLNVLEDSATRTETISINDLVIDRLIEPGLFTEVRLIDSDGVVILNTRASSPEVAGTVVSDSPSYLAGRDAAVLGEDQRTVIYRSSEDTLANGDSTGENANTARMDIVQVVYYNNRDVAGYLVAALNTERAFLSTLTRLEGFIPVVSYITTAEGLVLSLNEDQAYADESRARPQTQTLLTGNDNVNTYLIEDDQYTNFIAPITGTRFWLVVETPQEVPLTSPTDTFIEGGGLTLLIVIVFLTLGIVVLLNRVVVVPLNTLRLAIQAMSQGNFDHPVEMMHWRDEFGTLAQSFVSMREQVRQTILDLETRVAERVRDIQATQEVSRFAANQRDLQRLMDEVVNLILGAFPNIYHAQIFLIDSEKRYAVLRASTGEAGVKLLERGHRLAVGSVSVIGQVTGEGRTIIARDTSASTVHKRNEFLPDTRAELAIPLRAGDLIIGALDVQSKQDNSFTEDQVNVLQVMADQIAISLDNARLYQESLQRLEQLAESSRQQTLANWQQHMYLQRSRAVVKEAGTRTSTDTTGLREEALRHGETVVGEKTARNTIPFAVPIQLRGQVLGAVEWELPAIDFSYDKVLLAEELVNRLAISLDNARLFEQSQRATERERVVNDIASKLTGQTDIDDILQTAIREVGQALRVPEVNIRLNVKRGTPGSEEYHSNGSSNGYSSNGGNGKDGHHNGTLGSDLSDLTHNDTESES